MPRLQGATTESSPSPTPGVGAAVQTIGIEGRAVVDLPKPNYAPKPLDDRTELILRVEKIEPAANGQSRYHFHYIGLEPGAYVLADYLVRPDGSRPDEIGDAQLQVKGMLPEDHNGQLNAYVPRRFPFIGGYRALLATVGVVWVGGLVAFARAGRKKKPAAIIVPPEPEPSFAERLRPLVEAAAAGQLSVAEQASLERLLMGFWREKLALPEMRMAEALNRLKAHGEAGTLLRAVERWLHQPGGGDAGEIRSLLQPYRNRASTPATPANAEHGWAGGAV